MLELFNKNIVPQWEDIRAPSQPSVLALATLLAIDYRFVGSACHMGCKNMAWDAKYGVRFSDGKRM